MAEEHINKDEQNQYAENIKGEPVFILDAESGKKGYFCIGCKAQMQAVRAKIQSRRSYFRHDATDVNKNNIKCTFSNEHYRHKQAMNILNRIKRIKVPPIYKYPPRDIEGKKLLIKKSEFIEAKYTKSELTFYETDEGDVKFGKNPEIESRNLLIRPDVTFFNTKDEPILLVEIVVTHKVDAEKAAKIRRLGIDTIQVIIPKDSLENIEKSFSTGLKTKWIHNNEQERTEYVFSPGDDSEGISQIDELQRKLFEESFECRKAQISNLLRAIEKNLGSQHYRGIEREFRQEIQRVEDNTSRVKQELKEYRNGIRERVSARFRTRRDQLAERRRKVEKRYSELERRYLGKRGQLEDEQREIRELERELETYEARREEDRGEARRIESDIERIRKNIRGKLDHRETKQSESNQLQEKERERIRTIKNRLEQRRRELPEDFEEQERELRAEFERIGEQRIRQIKSQDHSGSPEVSRELKKIFDTRSLLNDWDAIQLDYQRNRKAWECFREGTHKDWNE